MFAARTVTRPVVAINSVLAIQARDMATLKEISLRLKSVSNIAKITKSMKMIASTKVARAQRIMENARVYGVASNAFFQHAETADPADAKPVLVTVSSDRGLCGGIHSSVSKATKKIAADYKDAGIVILGQKAKVQIARDHRDNIQLTFDQVAKNLPSFTEAALIADRILKSGLEFNAGKIVYNKFVSVIAYDATVLPFYNFQSISESPKLSNYEYEDETLKNLEEFTLSNSLYWAIAEGNAAEMAAKRTAMENATKNADEMIQKLTLIYNRSRQASITNDLIDIITGASAM
ncbi:ATP synthase F1, gamma subunit [Polychytrium aggregatum]|uniref:ATP synthase F1, gamma subunit n=1 Tax=Polychytrium aggregatum TaxID=110093 RepID=UPI0022FE15AB|nr:ATP synthase F1, gamma subunit [Polychytrium aggregatum]KAI9203262.1 ATP synthase F1, gamma subunit [Polychytrium aggregatum]